MLSLAITIAVSFVCGCLSALGERRASRIINPGSVAGALLYSGAILAALGFSLVTMALVGATLGTYSRDNNSVTLASYAAGFAFLRLVYRARDFRPS